MSCAAAPSAGRRARPQTTRRAPLQQFAANPDKSLGPGRVTVPGFRSNRSNNPRGGVFPPRASAPGCAAPLPRDEMPVLAIKRSICCSGRHHATITLRRVPPMPDSKISAASTITTVWGSRLCCSAASSCMRAMMRGWTMALSRRSCCGSANTLGPELLPVDAAAGIEDLFPEAIEDFLISGAAGLDQLVPDAVGVDDVRAQVLESIAPRCFFRRRRLR